MNVEIFYCVMWNYLPKASRVEEELKKSFQDIDVKLSESFGGDFRVLVNGNTIFDKGNLSRFPDDGEITQKIKEL